MEYYSWIIHELRHAVWRAWQATTPDKSKVKNDAGPAAEGSGVAVEALLLDAGRSEAVIADRRVNAGSDRASKTKQMALFQHRRPAQAAQRQQHRPDDGLLQEGTKRAFLHVCDPIQQRLPLIRAGFDG
jgi:hypothetical protein